MSEEKSADLVTVDALTDCLAYFQKQLDAIILDRDNTRNEMVGLELKLAYVTTMCTNITKERDDWCKRAIVAEESLFVTEKQLIVLATRHT